MLFRSIDPRMGAHGRTRARMSLQGCAGWHPSRTLGACSLGLDTPLDRIRSWPDSCLRLPWSVAVQQQFGGVDSSWLPTPWSGCPPNRWERFQVGSQRLGEVVHRLCIPCLLISRAGVGTLGFQRDCGWVSIIQCISGNWNKGNL